MFDSERAFTYTKYIGRTNYKIKNNNAMSQTQYLKMLEREINKINKKIDLKILQGQEYRKEARDHKLLLRKVRYNARKSFMDRFVNLFFRTNIYA